MVSDGWILERILEHIWQDVMAVVPGIRQTASEGQTADSMEGAVRVRRGGRSSQ